MTGSQNLGESSATMTPARTVYTAYNIIGPGLDLATKAVCAIKAGKEKKKSPSTGVYVRMREGKHGWLYAGIWHSQQHTAASVNVPHHVQTKSSST